ncbi:MAG: sialidase family protein [Proteobacteria bacterium]|nr:sialidase family protein [Pseudomonadota bacterium]
MSPVLTTDVFVGRRRALERSLVCAMQGQFPVLARGAAGELVAVFRTGAGHYGLSGTLATACSIDGGRQWSDPIEVAPRGDDVRNPALGIAADGRWVLAYWRAGDHCYPASETGERRWRIPSGATEATPDLFVIASSDRGRTWSTPRPQRAELLAWASPFGRIICSTGSSGTGTLLMAAYGPPRDAPGGRFDAIVLRSVDGGATWGDASRVLADASELSLCAWSSERLVGAVRRASGDTAIVQSDDDGRTWSAPIAVTRPGEHPADLCRLAGGRLLLTFGRRRRPLGCGALTSVDGGATWDRDHEVLLAGDGIGNDVGYPSTVQLDDGTIVTVLYFARGSAASEPTDGWGETSCQALRYDESLVVPAGQAR